MNEPNPSSLARATVHDGIATLVFGKPPLNILDYATLEEMHQELLALEHPLRLLVLKGSGETAFSAGASVQDHVAERVPGMLDRFHAVIRWLEQAPFPTLAAVEGHCLGGGLELAMSCDLLLAESTSTFGQPEIKLGCFPPVAAARLPRQAGYSRALEVLLTGRTVDYEEAIQLGWVHFTTPAGQPFEDRLAEVVEALTQHSGRVAELTKKALRAGQTAGFETALQAAERLYLEELIHTEDMHEGLQAFFEKRSPRWKHR